ncbi:MAG: inositol monophosphatase [Citromicrobium sp.]|nr:MAG: inositol monophosphatase [Citromicrobium sp.]
MHDSELDRAIHGLMEGVARDVILPRYRNLSASEIDQKGADDPVTIADREAEAKLRDGLARIDGSLAFVGEEAAHAAPSSLEALNKACWIVDPLDGTRNFAAGKGPFGILVARAENGVAQSGWIYDCLTGRFCSAHRGKGALIDGERALARPSGEAPPVAAISLVFMDEARREAIRNHVAPQYRLVDIPFCAAEQYPRLALGENDVSIFERTLVWDHAAGVLWLEEAGGMAARPDGRPYRVSEWWTNGLIAAASAELWHRLAELYARM